MCTSGASDGRQAQGGTAAGDPNQKSMNLLFSFFRVTHLSDLFERLKCLVRRDRNGCEMLPGKRSSERKMRDEVKGEMSARRNERKAK